MCRFVPRCLGGNEMKKTKILCVVAAAVCGLACLAGCGSKKIEVKPIPSDTLYVEKVENLPEDFIDTTPPYGRN